MLEEEEKRAQGVERRRKKAARHQEREDLRFVMGTTQGRRLMWRLMFEQCGVLSGSYTGDPMSGAYSEGGRRVGIELIGQLQRDAPVSYLEMLQERLAGLPEMQDEPDEDVES